MLTKNKDGAEQAIRDLRRATRRRYSAEESIRSMLEGLRSESSIAELCRKAALESVKGEHRPRLLSDNGPSCLSIELKAWLDERVHGHSRYR